MNIKIKPGLILDSDVFLHILEPTLLTETNVKHKTSILI